jgi:lysophospholipase L1-like esterase
VEPSLPPTARQRTPRHARAKRRHQPWIGAVLVAVAGAAAFGAVFMGTVAGAGTAAMMPKPTFRAIDVTAVVAVTPPAVTPTAVTVAPSDQPDLAPATRACPTPSSAPPDATPRPRISPVPVVTTTPVTRPVVAFLGDSYTTGYNGAGVGRSGWPAIVAASLDLRPLVRAVAGTGFVNPGWTGQPIRTRLSSVIKADPRIVILAGGHNDRRYASSLSARAADAVVDRLDSALPDAILVVIGPIWQDGSPPRSVRALRDHLRTKAAAVGAIFIDPIRGGWFAGAAHRFISADGIHPTAAGHRHVAALVLRVLRADPHFATKPAPPPAVSSPSPVGVPGTTSGSWQLAPCSP